MRKQSGADLLTAAAFLAALDPHRAEAERATIARYMKEPATQILGVRMKTLFDTAKAFEAMPLEEVERLLDSPFYEARMGAVSILDFRARRRGISDEERLALYELYLGRHDRIDVWDLVDRAAPRVVGGYLLDHPRTVLDELARSPRVCERRTAITATFWFIRAGDLDDTLRIAELLLRDPEEAIQRSVGIGLREAGNVDRVRLVAFLERHAAAMPRVTLRMACEKLDTGDRERLMQLGKAARA